MPPKSKKEQEEQAKRLQAERAEKEEEERLLQLERAKYASTTLSTGLILPFSIKPLEFISEKLDAYIAQISPELPLSSQQSGIIRTQLTNSLMFCTQEFGLTHRDQRVKQANLEKARVFVGIMLQVFLNDLDWIGRYGKTKERDWLIFKQLVLNHSFDDPPTRLKYFDRDTASKVIQFSNNGYFGHHFLTFTHCKFSKATQILEHTIHVDRPVILLNSKDTPFTDLTPKPEP